MKKLSVKKIFTATTVLLFAIGTQAQINSVSTSTIEIPEIKILGDTQKTSTFDFVPTVSVLSGKKLERKKQTSLGETLTGELGVNSTFFGPNASRPVIRGLDGDRISILSDNMGVLDASAASQDHEVSIETISIDRVEIVRGPSALLYGSNAVGGVVNIITNRIPEKSQDGFKGSLDTRHSSVDSGAATGLALNYGSGPWVFHFDGTLRSTTDYKIPKFARTAEKRNSSPLEAGSVEGNGTVPNSANKTNSRAVGASYITEDGSLGGLSHSQYESNYGTVAEQNVKIKMKQDRTDTSFLFKNVGTFDSIRIKNTYSEYKHEELNKGIVGTTFTNKGNEARLELKHKKWRDLDGMFGLQANVFDFEAIGDERFIPKTNNQNYSAFLFEEATYGSFKPSLSARFDTSDIKANETLVDTTPGTYGPTKKGASNKKSFQTGSLAFGGIYSIDSVNSLVLNIAYNERAPNYEELFANGPHIATAQYEIGNVNLGKETSKSLELSYRYKNDFTKANLATYIQEFQNFINLSPTSDKGLTPESSAYDMNLFRYQAVPARFYGFEMDVNHQLKDLPISGLIEVGFKLDSVTAKNRDTKENIPKIPPMRETLSATYKTNSYNADIEVQHTEAQTQTAKDETKTDRYALVNLGIEAPITWDAVSLSCYGRINNVFDAEARNHISVLKDIAPLPGRNLILGVQMLF